MKAKKVILELFRNNVKTVSLNGFSESVEYIVNSVDLNNLVYLGSDEVKSSDGYSVVTCHSFKTN